MEEIKTILFGGKVPIKLFKFRLDDTDFAGDWEKEYVQELIKTLKPGMTVYDIGAENGELTALAGILVGGENVHIFEPNADYFPNIKATWEANKLLRPANCFNGYVSDDSSKGVQYFLSWYILKDTIFHGCEHFNPSARPMQTVALDHYVQLLKRPDVVMMDIEGAELSAVRGAKKLIAEHSPIFFISIHKPEYLLDRSSGTKEELIKIFTDNGYSAIHLSTDHEEHWKFIKT